MDVLHTLARLAHVLLCHVPMIQALVGPTIHDCYPWHSTVESTATHTRTHARTHARTYARTNSIPRAAAAIFSLHPWSARRVVILLRSIEVRFASYTPAGTEAETPALSNLKSTPSRRGADHTSILVRGSSDRLPSRSLSFVWSVCLASIYLQA